MTDPIRVRLSLTRKAVLIVWGRTDADAMLAYQRAQDALSRKYLRITQVVTTVCERVSDADLYETGKCRFIIRSADYGHAWFAVPHCAVGQAQERQVRENQSLRQRTDAME